MNIDELPRGDAKRALEFPHFPTRLQAVIWRNWGLVPIERLAKALHATPLQIEQLAAGMGLSKDDSLCHLWHERGYLTIIRRNWHLLPYRQILDLLGWTPDEMAYALKEDDFLWHKMGSLKPEAQEVSYAPLSERERADTADLKDTLDRYFPKQTNPSDRPFGFLKRYGSRAKTDTHSGSSSFGLRMVYSYSAVYGDPLLNDKLDPYPDGLLSDYAAAGINAVWLQGTLYTLVPWLGESSDSTGWQIRLANLRKLCARAGRYGIKVYLYLNEPRSMPPDFFEDHPDWKGAKARDGLSFAICTSGNNVLEALRDGVSMLFREVPELGGTFTITMSENLTHCRSRPFDVEAACPICAARDPAEIIAEINRAVAEGVHKINPAADVIAWTWGWWPDWAERAVALLPKDVKLMCVSEHGLPTDAMGIKGSVDDYSISKVGPGPTALRLWEKAQECGLSTVAKVQMNNTWECSAIPYVPVPGLIEEHLRNLAAAGVKDLMLSWTLGGYPGGNIELLRMPREKLAIEKYGRQPAAFIKKAWDCFDMAFREFPLHGFAQLYTAPQNFGPMNLLFWEPTGYKATMIGFPYDDLEAWRGSHYPEDVFDEQFRKMSAGWADGLRFLAQARETIPSENKAAFDDLANVSEAAYCHFRSTYLQIRFVRLRIAGNREEIINVLDEEIAIALRLHNLMLRDSRIGFEASNHYFYTANDLKEKILNCEFMKRRQSNGIHESR